MVVGVRPAACTVCTSTGEVAAALLGSPEYVAVMLCVPAVSVALLHVAVRVLPVPVSATALHKMFVPSLKVTVPVGAVPVTVAVKVTLWPTIEGLREEANVTPLPAACTT